MNKISVAMTTYNGSRYIIEQLESIRAQTQPVDEVIICDDRSTDNTVRLVRDYIDTHNLLNWSIEVNAMNKGFADNFMNAIRRCSGSLIFLADQDDVWYSDKVKVSVELMGKNPDIMSMAIAYDVCDSDGELLDMALLDEWRLDDGRIVPINFNYFLNGRVVRGASMCFRKSILDDEPKISIGVFGHDTMLNLYAILKGSAVFYGKILMKYRIHGANTSSVSLNRSSRLSSKNMEKRLKFLKDSIYVLERFSNHQLIDKERRKEVLRRLDFLKMRNQLIKGVSLVKILSALVSLKSYVVGSPYGLMGGWYILSTDIIFGLRYSKEKRAND